MVNYDDLIADRTQQNVNIIKDLSKKRYIDFTDEEKQFWIDNIKKGCYTYNDLNRVESLVQDIADRCNSLGLNVSVNTRIWAKDEIPSVSEMERYLSNIKKIRSLNIKLSTTPKPPNDIKLNYYEANNIEQIIKDMNLLLVTPDDINRYCGTDIYCGESF